jgi:hypothetical protein
MGFVARLPTINLAHVDLTGCKQRAEQHGGGYRLGPREAGDEGNQNRIEIVTLAIANHAFAQKLRWLFKR